ncbi:MAG: serine/threonine-protein kinase [Myxococcota bacterium]
MDAAVADMCLTDEVVVGLAEGTLTNDDVRVDALLHLEQCTVCSLLVAQASRLASTERRVMDRYLVHGELGSGGMGTVLRAFDPRLGRDVALKIVDVDPDSADVDRMLREGRALAMLNHPNVVTVYDVHRTHDQVIVAMELVEGKTLRSWLAQARSTSEIVRAFAAAGRALAAAHSVGLVHRDFKPANVMIADGGEVTVVDFGLATVDAPLESSIPSLVVPPMVSGPEMATRPGVTRHAVGTPLYMAPEQYEGVADAASDQYQFCLSLLEALCGGWPLAARERDALKEAKRAQRFVPDVWSRIPRRLRVVIERGLSADPQLRWPDMQTVVEGLEPPAGKPWVWLAALGLAGAGLFAAFPEPAAVAVDPCAGLVDEMTSTWGRVRAETLTAAFVATELGSAQSVAARTARGLDRYVERWHAVHDDVCTDRGEAPRITDAKVHCLARASKQLGALVESLSKLPRAKVGQAPRAVEGLAAVERCLDDDFVSQRTAVTDAWSAEQVAALESMLAEAVADSLTGDFKSASETAKTVATQAQSLEHEPLAVRALALRTRCLRALDDPVGADVGQEAYLAARLIGDGETAWKIAWDVSTIYRRLGKFEEAWRWLEDNEDLVYGLGIPTQEAAYLSAVGAHHWERRELDAALCATLEAVEILEIDDPGSRQHGIAVRRLAGVLGMLGRLDAAAMHLEEARSIIFEGQGDSDPELRLLLFEQGTLSLRRERFSGAIGPLEQALAMTIETQGNASSSAIENRGAVAFAYIGAGRLLDGATLLREAISLAEQTEMPPRAVMMLYRDLARASEGQNKISDAVAAYVAAMQRGTQMEPSARREHILSDVKALAADLADRLGDTPDAARLRAAVAAAN